MQVRAAMVFNGHTIESVDAIDEDTFTEICVMYADKVLGSRAVFDAITPLTTAIYNYIRSPNTSAFRSDQIFPWVVEYDNNPDYENSQDEVNDKLLLFMTQAPNFNPERFKNGGSA